MSIFFLLNQVALPLYLILAALAVWFGWRWNHAREKLRSTYYELERDLAQQKLWDAATWIGVLGMFALMILGIQRSVVPFLETELSQQELVNTGQTAQDGEYSTATPAPVSSGLNIEPVAPLGEDNTIILLTPTLTPTPVGTIVPNAPSPEGCVDPRATLQIPVNGMRVFQPISIVGTAYTDSFAVAKLEIKGPGTNGAYAVIDDKRQEIRTQSEFSQFAPAPYTAGEYQFRLTVFDITDTLVASCMVTIYITEPPTTPTPTALPN